MYRKKRIQYKHPGEFKNEIKAYKLPNVYTKIVK